MNNCYMFLNNKRDFNSVFFNVLQYGIYQIFPKNKAKEKFQNHIFPRGGFEPTTIGFEVHCLHH